MLEQTHAELERTETTALDLICADARDLSKLLPGKVDYVLIANTFHGVPDKIAMARAVAAVLNPRGQFAIVNWHPLPRERTVVLSNPRGPKTEMRMSPDDVRLVVEPAGFTLERVVELLPFHYGAAMSRKHVGEAMSPSRSKLGWLAGLATVLSLFACYGTLAAIAVLGTLGIAIALDEALWAGAVVAFAAIAVGGLGLGPLRHRQHWPFLIDILGAVATGYAM